LVLSRDDVTHSEFEDAAAIQALAGLLAGGKDVFNALPPQRAGIDANPAGFAEKAYAYARALVEHRRNQPGRNKP
jgi:alkylation response protein AidB-like acyl-CoA dehydrogenase